MRSTRTALSITTSVWSALFLRESVSRLFSARISWFWLFFEPAFQVGSLLLVFTALKVRSVGGIDPAPWLLIGLLAYQTFVRSAIQVMNSIDANRELFTYRQVKPVDACLVRGGLEGFLIIILLLIFSIGAALLDAKSLPADPLLFIGSFAALWLMGIGFGLISSAASELLKFVGKLIISGVRVLFFVSGVMLPINIIPEPYREWFMINPLVHGLESARFAFLPSYHIDAEVSLYYSYFVALVLIFFGLALHRYYAERLTTQ